MIRWGVKLIKELFTVLTAACYNCRVEYRLFTVDTIKNIDCISHIHNSRLHVIAKKRRQYASRELIMIREYSWSTYAAKKSWKLIATGPWLYLCICNCGEWPLNVQRTASRHKSFYATNKLPKKGKARTAQNARPAGQWTQHALSAKLLKTDPLYESTTMLIIFQDKNLSGSEFTGKVCKYGLLRWLGSREDVCDQGQFSFDMLFVDSVSM